MTTASLPVSMMLSYTAGILVSFTPCVYPVIPMTVSFIGARAAEKKHHAFMLSLVYVLGMAVVYSALGFAAAVSGAVFGQFQSNIFTYLILGNLFLVMGLAMFDVFVLPVPGFLKFQGPARPAAGLIQSFFVGMLSGLVVGPCTAPVLASILAVAAAGGESLRGISMLFSFAMGMGTILIVLGTFTGLLSRIPRSGEWMIKIKKIFAVLMLLVAEYMLIKAGTFLY